MHPAPHIIEGEEIVRSARINEGADADRNDRQAKVIWAAGFVDGEGCISISSNYGGRRSRSLALRLCVAQVDRRPVDILAALFTGSILSHIPKPPRRKYYQWAITSRKALSALIELEPFLINKREQAQLAIEFQNMKLGRSNGSRLTDEEAALQQSFSDKLKEMHWR